MSDLLRWKKSSVMEYTAFFWNNNLKKCVIIRPNTIVIETGLKSILAFPFDYLNLILYPFISCGLQYKCYKY
jgi:hypothetical protein